MTSYQAGAGPQSDTQPGPAPEETSAAVLIVEDALEHVAAGQMRKSEFLDQMERSISAAADSELIAVGRSAQGCPYITNWVGYYRTRSSQQIERALRRYAPEATGSMSAPEYIPFVAERVRKAAGIWAATEQITGVPEELVSEQPSDHLLGRALPLSTTVTDAPENEARNANDPRQIRAQLGSGHSLDHGVRSRMESAFGRDFSRVRVHTGAKGAELAMGLNARAFTVGSDIAFRAGEYQPGTLIGDALLAHELAHVSQQNNASESVATAGAAGSAEYDALERDADASAAHAVVSLWGLTKGFATGLAQTAMPRLQSGLRLSSCKAGMKCDKKVEGLTTCDQICDEAYKDSDCNHGGGGVICNGATMCACVFDMPPPLNVKRGECPELDKVVKIHEERHFPDQDCDPKKGLHRPPAKDPSKLTASECAHRKESKSLLDEAIKKASEPCKTKMTEVRDALDTWVKANCGEGGP